MIDYPIMIVGVGGAGCNMAETFKREAAGETLKSANYVFVGTADDLSNHHSDDGRLLLDTSSTIPDNLFNGVKKVFILAGMGGKTGTSFTPTIAKQAKSAGVCFLAVALTTPFNFEGETHIGHALDGISQLKSLNLDLLLILDNEKLLSQYGNISVYNAFDYADKAVLRAVEESMVV